MYAELTPTAAIPTQNRPSTDSSAAAGWDEHRDGTFFRLTATLFAPAFTSGAGVLLASYDED